MPQSSRADLEQPVGSPNEAPLFAKRFERFLLPVGLLTTFWGIFYPHPYRLVTAVLIGMPWLIVALVALSGGVVRFTPTGKGTHLGAPLTVIFPGFVLALHAFTPNLYYWPDAAILTVVIGSLFASAVFMADPQLRSRPWDIALLALFGFPLYGYGAGVQMNRLLDNSPPRQFTARVESKEYPPGSKLPPMLFLYPWGPKRLETDAWVSRSLYKSTRTGDTVCIELRRGALLVQWYTVRACPS